MKFLKFHEFLDRGGMLCPWGQNMTFWGKMGHDCHRCGIAMPPWARSLTFLVLRLIDLTNEKAGMG